MTLCEKISKYMKENDGITPLDAMREFGCMRLAPRINDLRKAGHDITTVTVKGKNRYGETVHYAKYSYRVV